MKVVAIVQARMGSTRLPGKVLQSLGPCTLLQQVIARVNQSQTIDEVVIATTTAEIDAQIEDAALAAGVSCFRGSEKNVLHRYYESAVAFGADTIVRVTADDPFKSAELIDKAVKMLHSNQQLDYVSNTLRPSYPEGLDVEVFTFEALENCFQNAALIRAHPDLQTINQGTVRNAGYLKSLEAEIQR